jgi:arylsulfatase A-like enzyme
MLKLDFSPHETLGLLFCHPEAPRGRGTSQLVKLFQACVSNQQMRGPSHSLGMTTYVFQPRIALLKIHSQKFLLVVIAALSVQLNSVVAAPNAFGAASTRHVVLVVWDGMRPDFVTEKYAPTLEKLAHDGVRFRDHHAIYPTATEVNGAALATGCYPNRNGLAANFDFRPAINPRQPVDMRDPDSIKRGDEVSSGKYLAVPTFVELLRAAGKKVALAGAKSVAMLFDRHNDWTVVRIKGKPLTIFAAAPLGPSAREEMTKLLGPIPDDPRATSAQRTHFATRALTEFFWRDGVPDFSLLWLSEPDLAEHSYAPGSPEALAAIKAVDEDLATVLSALDKKKVRDSTDIFVVSDHGFSTVRRSIDVVALLNKAGFHAAKEFSESPKPGDILVCGNGGTVLFYVRDHDRETTQRLVDWLQHSDFAGVIFTRDKSEGTFLLSDIRIDAPNSADVVVSFRCDQQAQNQFGVAGMIDADWNRKAGEGTHATLSPKDTHNLLVAAGPFFDVGREDNYPTSNLDLFPTILEVLDVPLPSALDGRFLHEVMRKQSENKDLPVSRRTLEALRSFADGQWKQTLHVSRFPTIDYFDEGNGEFHRK